jgi:hypothetical protein
MNEWAPLWRGDKMPAIKIGLILIFHFMFIASPIPASSFSREEEFQKMLRSEGMGKAAERWICIPQIKNVCSSEGCKLIASDVRMEIFFRKATFRRCFKGDCKAYPFKFKISGAFSIVSYGSAAFLKAGNPEFLFLKSLTKNYDEQLKKGWPFVDIASRGTTLLISHGYCRPVM